MIELFHADMSTCAQKVRLVLSEKGLPWEGHTLNLRHRDQHKPDYLKLNPNGVVPTLVDNKKVIIESTVICEYLDEAYPDPPLKPRSAENRALMRRWTKWLDEVLHYHTGVLSGSIAFRFQHLARPPEEQRAYINGIPDLARRERQRQQLELGMRAPQFRQAVFTFQDFLTRMEEQLTQTRWMAGATYSLADIGYTPYLIRLHELNLHPWMETRPRILDWFARIEERPNYTEAYLNWRNADYFNLMQEKGASAWSKIDQILSGKS
ncbi:MAG: glutathione S-transferase family protein [Rhodospirillaceae bacterium]